MKLKTKNPGKQRKNWYTGGLHTKRKQLVAPLDKKIQSEVGKKSIAVRKGDSAKILIGKHKGKTAKVERVDYINCKVYLTDIKYSTNRGQEKLVPFTASNLLLTNVVLEDTKRMKQKVANKKVANKKGELNGK